MKNAIVYALLAGAFFAVSTNDASAQGRGGRGGNRGGGYYSGGYGGNYGGSGWHSGSYYGNSWSYPRSYGYGYGYSPWYGGGYRSYYSSPSYSYSEPSYSYSVPLTGNTNPVTPTSFVESNASRQALLTVFVPSPDAKVWLQGMETTMTGTERSFYSPTLETDTNYTYTVKASWTVNGNAMEQTREVPMRAGQRSAVDFRVPNSEAAPRPLPAPEARPNK